MDRTLLGNVHGHLKLVLNIINPSSMEGVLDLSDHISVDTFLNLPEWANFYGLRDLST